MRLPKSYADVTIEQYQEIQEVYQKDSESIDTWIRIVCILTNKQVEEVEAIRADHLKWIFSQISWIRNPEFKARKRKYILVNWKLYKACNYASDFNTAQITDIKGFLNRGDFNSQLHNLAACIFVPWRTKQFDYSGKDHAEIAKAFKKVKFGKVAPTVFFYSKVWKASIKAIQESGIRKAEAQMFQSLGEILNLISEDIGDGKLQSTN